MNAPNFMHKMSDLEQKYGNEIYEFCSILFNLNLSLTGKGVRDALKIIEEYISINTKQIQSSEEVFDWKIPLEWVLNDAYILDESNNKILDVKENILQVVNYSNSIDTVLSLNELKQNIHTIKDEPEAIPYVTSYYNDDWGFCMKYNDYTSLKDGKYRVVIDSEFKEGCINIGELYLKGRLEDEVLISTYTCHPRMANDNLSGIAVGVFLAKILSLSKTNYSYRFLFLPETIGPIAWLNHNKSKLSNIKNAKVLSCLGDENASVTYQKSKKQNSDFDAIYENLCKEGEKVEIQDFLPYISDERQYSSLGFDIPTSLVTRSMPGKFTEYHTSKDDMNFINKKKLIHSLYIILKSIFIYERNFKLEILHTEGEPFLGKRNLHKKLGGFKKDTEIDLAFYWIFQFADSENTILDISKKSNLSFDTIFDACIMLEQNNLLKIHRGY